MKIVEIGHARQSFQKIKETLKINILNKKFQRTIVEKKFPNIFFSGPERDKLFLTWSIGGEKTLFKFLLIFNLKQKIKEDIPPAQAPKNVNKIVCPFKGNSQNFLRSCAKLKSNILKWKFEIKVQKQFGTICQVPVFSLKNHSTLVPTQTQPGHFGRSRFEGPAPA